ncbi:MAG: hypothetical protein PHN30_02165 [Bacteroidales bacterium]|nr:hypothetical protein [Bacteroidales bacterium]
MNRKLKILLMLLPFMGSFPLLAQTERSFAAIDSLSYQAWQHANWKEVRQVTQEGFALGYDYYFLRMRAGMAELNLNKPLRADVHFKKALTFSQNDPNALAYRYLALLGSGHFSEARLIVDSIPQDTRERFHIQAPRLITSVFVEPGYMLAAKASDLKSTSPDAPFSHHYLVPSYSYVGAGLNLNPHRRLRITLAANNLKYFALQYFAASGSEPIEFEVPFDQNAFYLAGSWYLGKGFTGALAGQVLSATYPLREWQQTPISGSYVEVPYFYRDMALHASLSKQFAWAVLTLRGDWNRFKSKRYIQGGADLTLYPAGNTNIWVRGEMTLINGANRGVPRLVSSFSAGKKLFGNTWLEAFYSFGEFNGYTEKSAWVVYNNYDPIVARAGANLLVYSLTSQLDLAVRYQWSQRISTWQLYDGDGIYTGGFEKQYHMHSLTGGITWRF